MQLVKHAQVDLIQDGYINNLEKELLAYAETQGRQNGEQNRPLTEPELKAYAMNLVETKVQAAIDYNQQLYQPISGMVVAQKIKTDATEKVKQLKAALGDDEHKLNPLQEKKKGCCPDLKKKRVRTWVHIGIGIISAAEGFFIFEALRSSGFRLITALITSLGIAIAIGYGAHILAGYILKAKNRLQRFIRYCIVLIPAFLGFAVIGHIRAAAYNNATNLHQTIAGDTSQSQSVSGWAITIISFILFLAALLFSMRFHKSEEERAQEQEYDLTCQEIDTIQSRINARKKQIEQVKSEAILKVTEALKNFEYALARENRLVSIAKHSMEVYKEKNLRHRTDGLCPDFFSYPPPFHFKLFFDKVNNTSNNIDNPKAA